MKMTSFKIKLADIIQDESSRQSAHLVFQQIIKLLKNYQVLKIDLQNTSLTPSIADEIFGKLAISLGGPDFKQKIKILNGSTSQMILIKHVIANRVKGSFRT